MSKLTKEELISRFKTKHGDLYDYSRMVFTGLRNSITIICPIHGEFTQIAYNHQFCGCKKCYEEGRAITKEKIIEKFKQIHGDLYDYSRILTPKNYADKVEIICKKHGTFFKIVNNHIKGQGCPECYKELSRLNEENLIKQFRKVHGDKYNYDKLVFNGWREKVIITCPIHGDFEQLIHTHKKGSECQQCGKIKQINAQTSNSSKLIDRFIKLHEDKYLYGKVEYKGMREKITITCPIHGDFDQLPCNHLYNEHGCPSCSNNFSKPEEELRQFIQSLIPSAYKTRIGEIIPKQELDVYIPSRKIAFEFQGEYWHNELYNHKVKERDERKRQSCQKLEIKLYEIWENDWNNNKEETKQKIREIIFGHNT
jgi:Protein of unknown function (DUF723).